MRGIGVDVVSTHEVFDSLTRFGDRYLRRVFAPVELDRARSAGGEVQAAQLALCFAAKEAAYKALGLPASQPVVWSHLALDTAPPRARVIGVHAAMTQALGPDGVLVSVTRTGRTVHALAVAETLNTTTIAGDRALAVLTKEDSTMSNLPTDASQRVRKVLDSHAKMSVSADQLSDDDDLYGSGMTSHASVNVMLALEDEFDIEFPDEVLTRSTFSSIASIRDAIAQVSNG